MSLFKKKPRYGVQLRGVPSERELYFCTWFDPSKATPPRKEQGIPPNTYLRALGREGVLEFLNELDGQNTPLFKLISENARFWGIDPIWIVMASSEHDLRDMVAAIEADLGQKGISIQNLPPSWGVWRQTDFMMD